MANQVFTLDDMRHLTADFVRIEGKFHPAVHGCGRRFYWPNRTFLTANEAYEQAALAVEDAESAALLVCNQWNLEPS